MKIFLLCFFIRSARQMLEDHSVDYVTLPTLKYGYRTTKLEWEELQDILKVPEENQIARMSRSVEQQRDYEIYKKEIEKTWRSVLDHILVTKLGCEVIEKEGKLQAIKPESEVVTKVVLNDFPYYLADGVEHWVLWKLNDSIHDHDVEEAKATIRVQRSNQVADFLHWINPPHLQSLPQIDHVHILSRLDTNPPSSEASDQSTAVRKDPAK